MFNTLSGRFLGLTIIFVVIAEVLVFVPSMGRYREDYLQNRLELAQIAALVQLAIPADEPVPPALQTDLLDTADVLNVVLRRDGVRVLMLQSKTPPMVDASFDLRHPGQFTLMRDALRVFFSDHDRIINVLGQTTQGAKSEVEVTLHEWPLREALIAHGQRILLTSLVLSLAVAGLLFLAVQRLIVRPIGRVADHMVAYRDDPEDASRIISPQSGARELREAETALRDLQVRLTAALRQKERLAGLGGAVAKISHDLRNLLTTAQLLADRIDASADPSVRRTAPKLVNSLARAINLCERTLSFGKAEELPPVPTVFPLEPLVAEVLENERQGSAASCTEFVADIASGLKVRADADQLFRVLSNLVRNAGQAIEAAGTPGVVTLTASEVDGRCEIRVRDTGPGLAAAGAGQSLSGLPRQCAAGRLRAGAGHRRRADQGPRRHAGAGGDRAARVGLPHLAAGAGAGRARLGVNRRLHGRHASNSASTGTWSLGLSQPRTWRAMRLAPERATRSGVAQMWSRRRPLSAACQSGARYDHQE